MSKDTIPKVIYLKDYKKSFFEISDVSLTFVLDDTRTRVTSVMQMKATEEVPAAAATGRLFLSGEELALISIELNGKRLRPEEFALCSLGLNIFNVPTTAPFTLKIVNEINPKANTALDGLYKSGNIFCSQNEPEGFRRITYYLDRPDVMAKFTTKIIADKQLYPILLSNGNPIEEGDLPAGQHFSVWEDPFVKPCYLYALVAGDLGLVRDSFTTMNNRIIDLRIYCDKGNEDKCGHAMSALKNVMKWDEEVYGREYDLDIFMIVAVDAFNMGAMENKGLNIFNSSCVLASPQTAIDEDFMKIEAVVAHEYLHNWTGNRVTCRDWFQLTLKEGLTVFRDQEFSGAMNSFAVKRIEDILVLQGDQFVEDAGPAAHPIRPSSYMEINNFYTLTVYEKGAEVIRMLHTLLGEKNYRKGTDEYFRLFDGQAVTIEDFLFAMSTAYPWDLEKFKKQFPLWYGQVGTPEIAVQGEHDGEKKTYALTFTQTSKQADSIEGVDGEGREARPLLFPLKLGLLDREGGDFPLELWDEKQGQEQPQLSAGILQLSKESETFLFKNIKECPVPSINRGFSAPFKVHMAYSVENLAFLMANDGDSFNRFQAGQELGVRLLKGMIKDRQNGREFKLHRAYGEALGKIIRDTKFDVSLKAECLALPAESILLQEQDILDFETTYKAREAVKGMIAETFKNSLFDLYDELTEQMPSNFSLSQEAMGQRKLRNRVLSFLMHLPGENVDELCFRHFKNATNMTDELAGLSYLSHKKTQFSEQAVNDFYNKWKHETLVMQKWLYVQGSTPLAGGLTRVKSLLNDPVYDPTIPNIFRSLVGAFCHTYTQFHQRDGSGYEFVAEQILMIDKINPQMASALLSGFNQFVKLPKNLQDLMAAQLNKIATAEGLSKNTFEIVTKTLSSL